VYCKVASGVGNRTITLIVTAGAGVGTHKDAADYDPPNITAIDPANAPTTVNPEP
jgi:hypothetical protein